MPRKILVIDAHPDSDPGHYDHALAAAYRRGAQGHEVRELRLAELDFPMLRDPKQWLEGAPPPVIAEAQEQIRWADHLVFVYPLWLGDMPALLKAFLEQTMRPGFAFLYRDNNIPQKLLTGRTSRIIVTMSMPSLLYTMFFRAHSVKSFRRNILNFVGISPVRQTVIGSVADEDTRKAWLERVERLGEAGD